MHQPPAASHRVLRSRWHFFCICLIWLIALLACVGLWLSAADIVLTLTVAICVIFCGLWAAKDWFYAEQGQLRWDGQQWLWSEFGDQPVQRLSLALDFQLFMLLKLRAQHSHTRWLWLDAPRGLRTDSQWLAVRRAVVGTVGYV